MTFQPELCTASENRVVKLLDVVIQAGRQETTFTLATHQMRVWTGALTRLIAKRLRSTISSQGRSARERQRPHGFGPNLA